MKTNCLLVSDAMFVVDLANGKGKIMSHNTLVCLLAKHFLRTIRKQQEFGRCGAMATREPKATKEQTG